MLSETTLRYLSTLTYRNDAEVEVNVIPLGGIYWEDEMPGGLGLPDIPEEDHGPVLHLFALRVRIWRGAKLPESEQRFWDDTYWQVPNWALFHRLQVSADNLRTQELGEQLADEFEAAVCSGADELSVSEEGGLRHVSAIFDLTKDQTRKEN
jgi:hypothetical protein